MTGCKKLQKLPRRFEKLRNAKGAYASDYRFRATDKASFAAWLKKTFLPGLRNDFKKYVLNKYGVVGLEVVFSSEDWETLYQVIYYRLEIGPPYRINSKHQMSALRMIYEEWLKLVEDNQQLKKHIFADIYLYDEVE